MSGAHGANDTAVLRETTGIPDGREETEVAN